MQNILDVRDRAAFRRFPELYQRVRAYNVAFYQKRDPALYEQALNHLIAETRRGRMFGEWNDYGRLTEDCSPDRTTEKEREAEP